MRNLSSVAVFPDIRSVAFKSFRRIAMKRFFLSLTLGAALTAGIQTRAQQNTRPFVPVTDAMLEKPDPANWLMWRRTQDSWGYSPLNQINRNNVAQLRLI